MRCSERTQTAEPDLAQSPRRLWLEVRFASESPQIDLMLTLDESKRKGKSRILITQSCIYNLLHTFNGPWCCALKSLVGLVGDEAPAHLLLPSYSPLPCGSVAQERLRSCTKLFSPVLGGVDQVGSSRPPGKCLHRLVHELIQLYICLIVLLHRNKTS